MSRYAPPWSKLQKQLYLLIDPSIRFQIQCRLVRMDSQYGRTNLPRYWITLGKETIWSYPGDFVCSDGGVRRVDSGRRTGFPHQTDVAAISALVRAYIDTPVSTLLSRHFDEDHWGLINILRAADRRVGRRHWHDLKRKTGNIAARKVLAAREARFSLPEGTTTTP